MDYGALIVGALLTVVGGVVTYALGWLTHRRDRSEQITQRNRAERLATYSSFLEAVNNSAHRRGNLAENPYGDRAEDKQAAAYYFDQNVSPRMLTLRLVGTKEAVEAVTTLHDELRRFRERLTKPMHRRRTTAGSTSGSTTQCDRHERRSSRSPTPNSRRAHKSSTDGNEGHPELTARAHVVAPPVALPPRR
jgi:hypothetical protein